jgi:DNA-binding MarR family transcriptional regulator
MTIDQIIKSNVVLDDAKKIILNIMYTQNIVAEQFSDILKPFDLTSEQYNVLRILRGQKQNQVNMCTIQERMITKNSNTTRLIDKLLTKNLVTRQVCKVNRRKIEIKITPLGLDLLLELDPKVLAHEQFFAQNLNKAEQQQINNLLEKYRTIK